MLFVRIFSDRDGALGEINSCVLIISILVTKYYSGDKTEKNEIGGARSTYGREERCIQDFGGET